MQIFYCLVDARVYAIVYKMVFVVWQDQGTEEQDLAAEAEGGEVDPRQLYLAALFTPGAFRQGWKKPGFFILKKPSPVGLFL
jgi:hypothetical protein